MLLHLAIHLRTVFLHQIEALRCAQFFHGGSVGTNRQSAGRLHRLAEGGPSTFLRCVQFQLGFELCQVLGMTLSHALVHFAHVLMARPAGAGTHLGKTQRRQTGQQSGSDQGGADRFHEHPFVDGMPPV